MSVALKKNKAIVMIRASTNLLNRFIKKLIMSATISPSWTILDMFLEECDLEKSNQSNPRKYFKREVFIFAPISSLNILIRLIDIEEIIIVNKE